MAKRRNKYKLEALPLKEIFGIFIIVLIIEFAIDFFGESFIDKESLFMFFEKWVKIGLFTAIFAGIIWKFVFPWFPTTCIYDYFVPKGKSAKDFKRINEKRYLYLFILLTIILLILIFKDYIF